MRINLSVSLNDSMDIIGGGSGRKPRTGHGGISEYGQGSDQNVECNQGVQSKSNTTKLIVSHYIYLP
jgi:hypothetical protein